MLSRHLQPEILDSLPADDPRAIHSRRDLQRVNVIMGHAAFVTRALRAVPTPLRVVVELGTGDGTLLLRVAKHLRTRSGRVRAVLVDRQPVVNAETRAAFDALGWHVQVSKADVFEWLRRPEPEMADAMIANLFLHHFDDAELSSLLTQAAWQTRTFIACEPRRSRLALAGASLLRLLGCNQLTVHDGLISVRAGFRNREISAMWPPDGNGWQLSEGRTGLFTHTFVATGRR
jgi:Methyltransferase domain